MGQSTSVGTSYSSNEDEWGFEVEEPSKHPEEDQMSIKGSDPVFSMSSSTGANAKDDDNCPRISMEAVSQGVRMIRDLSMEVAKCSTSPHTASSPMPYVEDHGYVTSFTPLVSSVIGNHSSPSIDFQHSRSSQRNCHLASVRLSQETYRLLEQGRQVEFFDNYSMTYMVVRVQRNISLSPHAHVMVEDNQGGSVARVTPFSAQSHSRQHKGRKHGRRKSCLHRRRIATHRSKEFAQDGEGMDLKLFTSNSIAWCREETIAEKDDLNADTQRSSPHRLDYHACYPMREKKVRCIVPRRG